LLPDPTAAQPSELPPPAPVLAGDPEAVRLLHSMIEAIGGAEIWGTARGLCIVERAYRPDQPQGELSHFHRDLVAPRLRVDRVRDQAETDFVVGSAGGWQAGTDGLQPIGTAQWDAYRQRWPHNIYVLYRRLAAADPALSVQRQGERGFAVIEAERPIASFQLDAGAHVIRWTGPEVSGGRREDWIYGPARRFGPVSFPAWGTRTDGSYRFDYLHVELRRAPFGEELFAPAAPPRDARRC
jgi:hypothetical protein